MMPDLKQLFQIYRKPSFTNGSFVVTWADDAGDLGSGIFDYLRNKLDMYEFADIDPSCFFSLRGVPVIHNVAQFPQCKLYCCDRKKTAFLLSSAPKSNWYEFLNTILTIARDALNAASIYTIGGMISLSAHTLPPSLLLSANSAEFKNRLLRLGLTRSRDFETPPGQRPTLSSYLMWLAQKQGINAANIWIPISFYMVNAIDPRACKKSVEFLDALLELDLTMNDLTEDIEAQDNKIREIRLAYPEIEASIIRLENNMGLDEEESENLIKMMTSLLRKKES